MPDRIRFHLDEHVDPDIARALRTRGIDVTTTIEAGLRTRDDAAQIEYIRRKQRVLVTDDPDFLTYAASNPDHPGIAYCDRTVLTIGEIIRALEMIYEVLTPEEMKGTVQFLTSLK